MMRSGGKQFNAAKLFAFCSAITAVWALSIWVSGGFTVEGLGLRFASHDPVRPLAVAILLLILHCVTMGLAETTRELAAAVAFVSRLSPIFMVTILVVVTTAIGVKWTSHIGGGADSYGYVSQADLWLRGQLKTPQPFALKVPWPAGPTSFAPLGYLRTRDGAGIAPLYASGLSMLMAIAKFLAGHRAVFWVVPLAGAVLILTTFGIGRRLGSAWTGGLAASLVATSPIFLIMLVNPMSDVPATAFWALATYSALMPGTVAAFISGLCASVAILIRPNLVPIAAAIAMWLLWPEGLAWRDRRRLVAALARCVVFAMGAIPGVATVAALNNSLYGSPTTSGYSNLHSLFAWAHIPINLAHWSEWTLTSQTPLAIAGFAVLFLPALWLWRTREARRASALLAMIACVVIASYAAYEPFDGWWFLRFLLPMWPALAIGMAVVLVRAAEIWKPWSQVIVAFAVVAIAIHGWSDAKEHGMFLTQGVEQRYATVAQLVRKATPPESVILAMQHSGTLRYYGGRLTLRWDELDVDWLDRAVTWMADQGAHPYLLLEKWERDRFTDRFRGRSPLSELQRKPVFVFDQGDNSAYLYDLLNENPTEMVIKNDPPVDECPEPAPPPVVVFR